MQEATQTLDGVLSTSAIDGLQRALKALLLDFLPQQPDIMTALLPSREDVRSVGIEDTSPLAARLACRRGLSPEPSLHGPHSYAQPPGNLFL